MHVYDGLSDDFNSMETLRFSFYVQKFFDARESPLYKDVNNFWAEPEWEKIHDSIKNSFFVYSNSTENAFKSLIKASSLLYMDLNHGSTSDDNLQDYFFNYLESYYRLVQRMYAESMFESDASFCPHLVETIESGFVWKNNNIGILYRFFSPLFLETLLVFYDFLKSNSDMYKSNDKVLSRIYKDVAKEKFKRLYAVNSFTDSKGYLITPYNVKVPSYAEKNNLSSIEMVRPIRWLEKIRAYILDNMKSICRSSIIKVAVIGYVNIDDSIDSESHSLKSEELSELSEMLLTLYSDINFEIHVFLNKHDIYFKKLRDNCVYQVDLSTTNNNFEKTNNNSIKINVEKMDYTKLLSPDSNGIKRIIGENNIILLLDVPQLYSNEYRLVQKKPLISNTLEKEYRQEYSSIDLKSIGLPEVVNILPIRSLVSKINILRENGSKFNDTILYRINNNIIDALHDIMGNVQNTLTPLPIMHILISSRSSVDFSSISDDNYAREERYNGKTFRLITIRNAGKNRNNNLQPYTSVDLSDNKNYIVFSLWNLLKNIDVNMLKNEYSKEFSDMPPICVNNSLRINCCLMFTYIKMTWDSDFTELHFDIKYDAENASYLQKNKYNDYLKWVKKTVASIFNAIFSENIGTITKCIRSASFNTIYSQIEYLDDAIMYCLIKSLHMSDTKPCIIISDGTFNEKPVFSVNMPERWTVVKSLETLQNDSILGDDFIRLRMSISSNMNMSPEEFLFSVRKLCRKNGYTNSVLYKNVNAILEHGL